MRQSGPYTTGMASSTTDRPTRNEPPTPGIAALLERVRESARLASHAGARARAAQQYLPQARRPG